MENITERPWIASLRIQIRDGFRSGEQVCGTWLADRNHMSMRTLQRRLLEHGVKLRDLVREERLHLAFTALKSDQMRVKSLAPALGYASSSSLCRAFRAWTNETTRSIRRRGDAESQPTEASPARPSSDDVAA
jgi:AraC-like DNA-binding protein